MILNINDWKVSILRYAYGIEEYQKYKLPKSLCTFFWSFIFVLLILPISFPLVILNYITMKKNKYLSINHLISILIFILGFLIVFVIDISDKSNIIELFNNSIIYILYKSTLMGYVVSLILFFAMGVIIFPVYFIKNKIDNYKRDKKYNFHTKYNPHNIFIEYLKAIKKKTCPIIEYTH